MLVLRACFGVKPVIMQQPSKDRVVVDAFAKIGGKYLGKLVVPTKINSMFDAIRGVQRQGAKLLPHHERPFEYLIFFLDGIEFPCVTYATRRNWFDHKHWMYTLFNKVTSKTRIDLVWQEDDSFAFNLIKYCVKKDGVYIRTNNGPGLPKQLGVLAFTHRPVMFTSASSQNTTLD